MGLAVAAESPVDKLKYVLAGVISPNYYMNMFLKPVHKNGKLVQSDPRRDSAGKLL